MTDHQIEVDGIIIDIIRKPIKNMNLRVYPPEGTVRVTAPFRLSLRYIRSQLEAKREWIHFQRAKLQSQSAKKDLILQTGSQLFFLGSPFSLVLNNCLYRMSPVMSNSELFIYIKPNASEEEKKAHINHWYTQEMRLVVPSLIEKWQEIIGVTTTSWGLRLMKTRWGSCNVRTRKICLNLNLMQKPILCLEYVIVHELVHLLEASHNARFYQLMDQFMPEWRAHKKALTLD